jgi:hypothetical protein
MCDIVKSRMSSMLFHARTRTRLAFQIPATQPPHVGHHEEAVLRDDIINRHPDTLSKQAWHEWPPAHDAMNLQYNTSLILVKQLHPSALLLCSIHNHA